MTVALTRTPETIGKALSASTVPHHRRGSTAFYGWNRQPAPLPGID